MDLYQYVLMLTWLVPFSISAHNLEKNHSVPPIGIVDKGELFIDNNEVSYKNWNTAQLSGKVRVVQHIAGRTSAKEQNTPLIEAIKAASLPRKQYQTTTIINIDDAIIGSGIFVKNEIKSNKKTFPWSQFIIDSQGVTAKAWQLTPAGSAIVVLDRQGRVQFVKDGRLTQQEVQQVTNLLHQLVNKSSHENLD